MPRIPTYSFEPNGFRGAQRTGAEIDPRSAAAPYAALEGVGHEIQRAGAVLGEIGQQRQKEQELQSAAEAQQKFTEESTLWKQENQHREDFGQAFKEWSDKRIEDYAGKMPNDRAAQVFKSHVLPTANRDWAGALETGEKTRLTNFELTQNSAMDSALSAHRYRVTHGEAEAANDLLSFDVQSRVASIETAFGKIAPREAERMKTNVIASAVLGASETDPTFARELLDANSSIDAGRRAQLVAHIDARQYAMTAVARSDFKRNLDAQFNSAIANDTTMPAFNPKSFAIFGPHAQEIQADAEQQRITVNHAVTSYAGVSDRNAGTQLDLLARLTQSDKPEDQGAAKLLSVRVSNAIRQQKDDIFGWQIAHSEEVRSPMDDARRLWQEADSMKDGPDRQAAIRQAMSYQTVAADIALSYQGHAPKGGDPSLYHNRESGDYALLTKAEATATSDSMVRAGPRTASDSMRMFASRYDPRHLGYAWKNLHDLPDEGHQLPPEWKMASFIDDQIVRENVIGSAQSQKEIKALTDDQQKRINAAFRKDDTWSAFVETLGGESSQMVPFLNQTRDIITGYARSKMLGTTLNEEQAIKIGISDILSKQWSPQTSYNGRQKLMVPRARSDWTSGVLPQKRTDEELDAVPVNLARAVMRLPTSLFKSEDMSWLAPHLLAKRGDPQVEMDIQNQIQQHARWVLQPDVQSYALYLLNPRNGNAFQPTDSTANNLPFIVPIDLAAQEQSRERISRVVTSALGSKYQESSVRMPGEYPPILKRTRSWPIFDPKYWSFEKPLMFPIEEFVPNTVKSTNMPALGGEWINQQPKK